MLDTEQQVIQRLKGAKRVLITCRQDMHVDSLASCLSLYLVLEKLGIPADVVVSNHRDVVDRCAFLPKSRDVVRPGHSLSHLVIKIKPKDGKLQDFRYEVVDDALHIYVTSSVGRVVPADVVSEAVEPTHDLIVAVDTPDLDSIGPLYVNHADFFYATPIINIDHSPANEQYGQINMVDITAVSTTELLYRLLREVGDQHLDEDVATALLAGMIAKTESFKAPNVTPKSLMAAAELVQRGARRDEIVHHLYRRHDVPTLRLWGRVLARLQHDEQRRFVWSLITKDDFTKSGASEQELPGIIDELIMTTPEARTVALLCERADGKIAGWLKTDPNFDAAALTKAWNGAGSRSFASFTIPDKGLKDAEKDLIAVVSSLKT